MKASVRRIMDQFAPEQSRPERQPVPVPASPTLLKVNVHEAPHRPADDGLPDTWTPEHVGKRIVEAFETLAKLPRVRGPKDPGNAWPQHLYDRADLNAQASLSEAEQRDRQRERHRTVGRATGEDLRRLDIVFDWLRELHRADEELCRVVQTWARLRASGRSVKDWCRDNPLSFQAFYRRRDKGLAIIVDRLGASPVW